MTWYPNLNFINFTLVLLLAYSTQGPKIVGLRPSQIKQKTIKFIFFASLINIQHDEVKAMTGWLGIRIKCQSGAIYLSMDCCFCVLAL
jgi:hypothetical protein